MPMIMYNRPRLPKKKKKKKSTTNTRSAVWPKRPLLLTTRLSPLGPSLLLPAPAGRAMKGITFHLEQHHVALQVVQDLVANSRCGSDPGLSPCLAEFRQRRRCENISRMSRWSGRARAKRLAHADVVVSFGGVFGMPLPTGGDTSYSSNTACQTRVEVWAGSSGNGGTERRIWGAARRPW